MNRKTMALIAGALLTFAANGHGETIPDKVDINLQQSNPPLAATWKDSKSVPGFNHKAHITMLKENGEQSVCLACHKEVNHPDEIMADERKVKQQEAVATAGSVKKYMHGQCLACHKILKKQGEKTGPISCKGCHKAPVSQKTVKTTKVKTIEGC